MQTGIGSGSERWWLMGVGTGPAHKPTAIAGTDIRQTACKYYRKPSIIHPSYDRQLSVWNLQFPMMGTD